VFVCLFVICGLNLECADYLKQNQSAHCKVNPQQKISIKIPSTLKFIQNAKTSKVQQCDLAVGLHLPKKGNSQTIIITTNNFLFFAGQEVHSISQHYNQAYLQQNLKPILRRQKVFVYAHCKLHISCIQR